MAILIATEEQATEWEVLPAGIYEASVNDIVVGEGTYLNDKSGQYETSDYLTWKFSILSGPFAGRLIWGFSSTKLTPGAKATPWVSALLGRPLGVGEQVDTDALLGCNCLLTLGIEPKKKDPMQKQNRVLAVSPALQPAQSAYSAAPSAPAQKTLTQELEADEQPLSVELTYAQRWLKAVGLVVELYGESADHYKKQILGEERGAVPFTKLNKVDQLKCVAQAEEWASGEEIPF